MSMLTKFLRTTLFLSLFLSSWLFATLPIKDGEAVITCFSGFVNNIVGNGIDPDLPVLAVFDVRAPEFNGAVPGLGWTPPNKFPQPGNAIWNASALGQIFGITLDDANPPNIYVAASSVYGLYLQAGSFQTGMYASGGPGGVYMIDGTSGAVNHLFSLPNSGPALGNITFDPRHSFLFVSNFEDGLIASYDLNTGNTLTYDHGTVGRPALGLPSVADDGVVLDPNNPNGQSGFTQVDRRVWAVQIYQDRLFYSIWQDDSGRKDPNRANEVWSIGIRPADGSFDTASIRRELILPDLTSGYSNPVSDIAFSASGKMLVAERVRGMGIADDYGSYGNDAHHARVLEYTGSSQLGWSGPVQVFVGNHFKNTNSTGGVDYGYLYDVSTGESVACDGTIWSTGDALRLNGANPDGGFDAVYGLQGSPASGNAPNTPPLASNSLAMTSIYVDFNGQVGFDKTSPGDVEIYRQRCKAEELACVEIIEEGIRCVGTEGDLTQIELDFFIRNHSPFASPLNEVVVTSANVRNLPQMLAIGPISQNGTSSTITLPLTITNLVAGETCCLEFQFTSRDPQTGEVLWCCPPQTFCFELPECPEPCFNAEAEFNCKTGKWDLTVTNYGLPLAVLLQVASLDSDRTANPASQAINLPPGSMTFPMDFDVVGNPTPFPLFSTFTVLVSLHGPVDPNTGLSTCCTRSLKLPRFPLCLYEPTGTVFLDLNFNGIQDPDEPGLADWPIFIETEFGEVFALKTDDDGHYSMPELTDGWVEVTAGARSGWLLHTPDGTYQINLDGTAHQGLNFAFLPRQH